MVPFTPGRKIANLVSALLVCLAGVMWLSSYGAWDPFSLNKDKEVRDKQKKRLVEQTRLAKLRVAKLKENKVDAELSQEVKDALRDLKQTFKKMDKRDQKGNQRRILQQMDQLKNLWQKAGEQKLRDQLKKNFSRVSMRLSEKAANWKKEMSVGDTKSLVQEMEAIQKEIEQLLEAKNKEDGKPLTEEEIQKIKDDLKKKLQDKKCRFHFPGF